MREIKRTSALPEKHKGGQDFSYAILRIAQKTGMREIRRLHVVKT